MKTDPQHLQQPRYDLYIVTENLGGTEDGEVMDGGHLNASYAASDTDERLRASTPSLGPEERLRVEITDQSVLDNNHQETDAGIVLKPVKVLNSLCVSYRSITVFVSGQKTCQFQPGSEIDTSIATPGPGGAIQAPGGH